MSAHAYFTPGWEIKQLVGVFFSSSSSVITWQKCQKIYCVHIFILIPASLIIFGRYVGFGVAMFSLLARAQSLLGNGIWAALLVTHPSSMKRKRGSQRNWDLHKAICTTTNSHAIMAHHTNDVEKLGRKENDQWQKDYRDWRADFLICAVVQRAPFCHVEREREITSLSHLVGIVASRRLLCDKWIHMLPIPIPPAHSEKINK